MFLLTSIFAILSEPLKSNRYYILIHGLSSMENGHPSKYCLSVGKHIIGYMICLDINLCMVALGRILTNPIDKNEDIVLIWQCLNLCIVMQTDNIFHVYNKKHRWNVHRCPMATYLYTFSSISILYRHDYSPSFEISFSLF